jgi:hypothetical protein
MSEATADDAPLPTRPRKAAKLSISLTGEALAAVEEIAHRNGIAEGDAVRRAIKLLKFMDEEMSQGTVFRMQTPGGEPERLRLVY